MLSYTQEKTIDTAYVGSIAKNKQKERTRNAAFEYLYKKYFNFFLQEFRGFFTDEQLVIDGINDGFLKAYSNAEKFDESKASFRSWLYIVIKNSLFDEKRKQENIEFINPDFIIEDLGTGNSVELNFLIKERDSQIIEMIKKLDSISAKIIDYRYFYDFSYAEIAKETSLPVGTIKAYLFRAKQQLKVLMLKYKFKNN